MDESIHTITSSLLSRVRARDAAAWERLVDLYSPLVYHWCLRKGLARENAEDVGQEVFLAVARSLENYQHESFRGWLRTITDRKIIDFWEKAGKQPSGQGGTDFQLRMNEVAAPSSASEEGEREERQILRLSLLDAIGSEFSEQDLRAFRCLVVDEKSPAEVAEEMKITRNQVYLAKSRHIAAAARNCPRAQPPVTARQMPMASHASLTATNCPDRDILLAFSGGKLASAELESIGRHLASCETCVAFLDSQTDSEFGASDLEFPVASPAEKDSEKSSLWDTAFEQLRKDSEFQRMKAKAKRIDILENGATASWIPPAESPRQPGDEVLPEKIGRYFVLKKLGHGGFANVYLARDPEQNRLVAIKVPRAGKLPGPVQIEEFLREARTAATLDHPHIVPVFDFDRLPGGGCYVVMKYVEGRSLESAMKSERLSFERVAELCSQVADALEYAHQRKFVHRDIKPANILLDQEGRAYVADFGLAIHEETQHRHKDERAGTWPYMSPEQVRGESHHLDARTDVWSLGVILYELLTRQKPFPSKNKLALEEEIQFREPKPPRSVDSRIPRDLERVCLSCLAKEISNRCPSAAVLAEEVRRIGPSKRRTGTLMVAAAAGLALTAILLTVGYLFNRSNSPLAGRWYPTLDKEPTALVISEIAPDSSWQYDRKRQEVMIGSSHPVVLGVGEINSDDFRLEVKIVKSTWQGEAGIAWGIHDIESEGMPALRYQVLFIHSHMKNGVMKYSLKIDHMESRFPPGGKAPRSSRFGYDECELPDAPDATEIPLEINIVGGQLREVRWQGKYVAGISDGPAMEPAPPLVPHGKFGLFNETGSTIFRDFRIQILPKAIHNK